MLATLTTAVVALFTCQALLVAGVAGVRPRGNIYVTIVVVALATAPIVFFADRLFFGRPLTIDGRIFFVLMHLTLGGFLFHFMTLPDRSVTLRILVELERTPGRTLSVEALEGRYSIREMIASRLQQLAQGQFIAIAADGGLTLKPRGVWFGRFVTGGRRLFRISSAN